MFLMIALLGGLAAIFAGKKATPAQPAPGSGDDENEGGNQPPFKPIDPSQEGADILPGLPTPNPGPSGPGGGQQGAEDEPPIVPVPAPAAKPTPVHQDIDVVVPPQPRFNVGSHVAWSTSYGRVLSRSFDGGMGFTWMYSFWDQHGTFQTGPERALVTYFPPSTETTPHDPGQFVDNDIVPPIVPAAVIPSPRFAVNSNIAFGIYYGQVEARSFDGGIAFSWVYSFKDQHGGWHHNVREANMITFLPGGSTGQTPGEDETWFVGAGAGGFFPDSDTGE